VSRARYVLEFHFSTVIGKKNTVFSGFPTESVKNGAQYQGKLLKLIGSIADPLLA
jgi:hypothetical protein